MTRNASRRRSAILGGLAALLVAGNGCAAQSTTAAPRAPVTTAADPSLRRLEGEIARLATIGGGTVGVAAIHLETGREVYLNRGEAFPMASTVKVPAAVQLLSRVDSGRIRLDSMVTLTRSDLHPGSGTIAELFDDPGVVLSLRNILELSLLISDNSAADLVMRTAGGPEVVTARMRAAGITGIRVDRPTVVLIGDFVGARGVPANGAITPEGFDSLAHAVSPAAEKAAGIAFNADPRDTATPEGFARLLEQLWRRQLLSAASTDLLLDIMRRCQTGEARIKGLLPPDVVVMHKTGTIGATTNDAGIIELPEGAGHVVTVVFVKGSELEIPVRERAIAQISRAIYDYFLFNPGRVQSASR
jgi:beta-lactamase class A